jgi:hypothetical protein
VLISVVKYSWVKCGEVLQCSNGPSNKVSNSIRRHIDSMKLLLIYSLGSIFYQCIYGCIPVQYCNLCIFIVVYVFLLHVYGPSSCHLALFGYPDGGFSMLFPQL